MEATMVSDDKHDNEKITTPTSHREEESEPSEDDPEPPMCETPMTFDLDMDKNKSSAPIHIEDNEEDTQKENHTAEFLKYHHKFNHCSPAKIQAMAKKGELPKYLATCNVPVCSACQFGKATRRPWRTKNKKNGRKAKKGTRPGQVKSTSVKETLVGKEAFERLAATYGIQVQHYHADNGTFAAIGWIDACYRKEQSISFAGVNAHHQNGRAEARIKHIQDMARTLLIHATKRWPKAINARLWPFAVRMANLSINATLWLADLKKLSRRDVFKFQSG
ncbi:unnamed protein product [Cylindrotheca closterium]|nr:unnamed protein product [Cylindrotheca closterium]